MSDRPSFSRRQMLVGTGLAGAAVAATGASATTTQAGETVAATDPRRVELKDTSHVRAYYALARD